MVTVQDRQAERAAFLLALYEMSEADPMNWVDYSAIGQRLGLDDGQAGRVAQYLVDHFTAEWPAMGGPLAITSHGVDVAEEALSRGAEVPASVVILTTDEQRAVEAFLTRYRQADEQGEIRLDSNERAEAEAEVATLEAQIKSPRPKRRIIKEAIRSLVLVLVTGAAGGVAGNAAYAHLGDLAKLLHLS